MRALTLLLLLVPCLAYAGWPLLLAPPPPRAACRTAVAAAAQNAHVPVPLALGIAQVESGRRQDDGTVAPWPWSINVEGTDHVYETKAEAVAAVRSFQAGGARSIDVGCMQVNLMYHPDAFPDLEDGFDPDRNAAYAMRFLNELHAQTQDWPAAAGRYHSATPGLGASYLRLVEAAMAQPSVVAAPVVAAPPTMALGPVGAIHLAATVPAGFGQAARGRSLADYRAIPVAVVGRR